MSLPIPKTRLRIFLLCPFVMLLGCSASTQITNTPRSSIEQRLLVRSLERAMGALDIEALRGKTVTVDLYGLTPDKDFAREFCTARLQGEHVRVIADPDQADLRVKIVASVLGVDKGQSFLGLPTVTVPFLGFTTPEVPLFKSVRHRGEAEIQVYALDPRSGELVSKSLLQNGQAAYDQYTILIMINFTLSDIDIPEKSSREQLWEEFTTAER
jgi:hypothetical protein